MVDRDSGRVLGITDDPYNESRDTVFVFGRNGAVLLRHEFDETVEAERERASLKIQRILADGRWVEMSLPTTAEFPGEGLEDRGFFDGTHAIVTPGQMQWKKGGEVVGVGRAGAYGIPLNGTCEAQVYASSLAEVRPVSIVWDPPSRMAFIVWRPLRGFLQYKDCSVLFVEAFEVVAPLPTR